jgi:16S rRNA (guanine1516-N2)-methyltransferase
MQPHHSVSPVNIAVAAQDSAQRDRALALSQQLGVPCVESGQANIPPAVQALLWVGADALSLQAVAARGRTPGPISVDFGGGAMRHRRRGGQNELLGKAVGIGKKPALAVLDATAGLGRDSFVLADLGCRVILAEREAVVLALLDDGLERAARAEDAWLNRVAGRMTLHHGEASTLTAAVLNTLDVIYLDPMFPERDKSAAVKKEMALFQTLFAGGTTADDAAQLLDWALGCDVARVVVKRPLRAPCLTLQQPSHTIAGKAVRYDVYVLRSLR